MGVVTVEETEIQKLNFLLFLLYIQTLGTLLHLYHLKDHLHTDNSDLNVSPVSPKTFHDY